MIIFVDASFLIALFNKDDKFHPKALQLSLKLKRQKARLLVTNIVLAEAINVIFRLKGAKTTKKFYHAFQKTGIKVYYVPKALFQESYSLLWKQKRKGLNFFDCLHLRTAKHLKIKTILTFDRYFKIQKIKVIGI